MVTMMMKKLLLLLAALTETYQRGQDFHVHVHVHVHDRWVGGWVNQEP